MKTIGNIVDEHAALVCGNKVSSMSTGDGIKLLELPDVPTSNCAANLYLAALETINKQAQRIWLLEQEKKK